MPVGGDRVASLDLAEDPGCPRFETVDLGAQLDVLGEQFPIRGPAELVGRIDRELSGQRHNAAYYRTYVR
jgi:hypothetical protein